MQEKLDASINSGEFEKYFSDKKLIKDHQISRIKKVFDLSYNSGNFNSDFETFLKWEDSFEDYWYTERFTQTNSNIFENLLDFIEGKSTKLNVEDYEEDFLCNVFSWNNYLFKLYIGQGSFWRIYKSDKLIFQSH